MIFNDWITWILGRLPQAEARRTAPEDNVRALAERERTLTLLLAEVSRIDQVAQSDLGRAVLAQLNAFLARSSEQVLEYIGEPEKHAQNLMRLRVEIMVARELKQLFSGDRIQSATEFLADQRQGVKQTKERIEELMATQPTMGKDLD
jgi:hypothetical protein